MGELKKKNRIIFGTSKLLNLVWTCVVNVLPKKSSKNLFTHFSSNCNKLFVFRYVRIHIQSNKLLNLLKIKIME